MEGAVEFYYEKLIKEEDKTPGITLAKFFGELFSIPISSKTIVMYNKLVKLYGRKLAFEATLESFESGANPENLYGLLSYICKKKIEKDMANRYLSLEELAGNITEKVDIAQNRKLKIRNPFDDKSV